MMATFLQAQALVPLALYFFILGKWHSGSRPRLVTGASDFGVLALGLGGPIAFGPVGEFLVDFLFPRESLAAWLAVASGVGLLALVGSTRARRRLVVYHVEGHALTAAIGVALDRITGPVHQTLHGFEDTKGQRGLTVEVGSRLGFGVVEAYGENPESLIDRIRPELKATLSSVSSRSSRLATLCFGLSFATIAILCASTAYLTRSEVRAVVRRIVGN
jgi:hypothetical protein